MPWGTPRTWIAGEYPTAAQMNQEIKENLNAVVPLGPGAWTAYTPTLVQSVAVAKTVTRAVYHRVGRTISVQLYLTCSAAGTAANAVIVGLPTAAASGLALDVGVGSIYDASANLLYKGHVTMASSTTVALYPTNSTNIGALGVDTFTAALASSDVIRLTATYEAAS